VRRGWRGGKGKRVKFKVPGGIQGKERVGIEDQRDEDFSNRGWTA